ncbi:hypothetical protein [Fulvimarina sp. MAC8]|uniref:hypothetical protein n=1 Tax=Fulvimarina sp. MAC8 TaxID=3162874 RepID=UPI0032EB94D9
MKSWTSMIAAGTALALLPQSGQAQESAQQCSGVPNASGIELLISVEGAPGRYRLTCQNGALVAVPAEAAGLVTSPTAAEQATESAANTADAMISGEMQIGRNMAGVGSEEMQGIAGATAQDETGSNVKTSGSGDLTPRTEQPLLEEAEPDGMVPSEEAESSTSAETEIENSAEETADDLADEATDLGEPPAPLDSDEASSDESGGAMETESNSDAEEPDTAVNGVTGSEEDRTDDDTSASSEESWANDAESFAEEPQEEMPEGIPSMATVDESTGTTDEAPVVSKPQGAVTKTGPGSLAQQMAAASQSPAAEGAGDRAADEMSSSSEESDGSGERAKTAKSEDGSEDALQATGVPSRTGPGTLEEQMAAATVGNGSTGAPSKTGPGSLEQHMSAATARSAATEESAGASDEADSGTDSEESNASSLESTGVPSRTGPGTLEEQMAAAAAGNGSTGAPSKSGPGTLEQQMSAATAQSAATEESASASNETEESTQSEEGTTNSLDAAGVPSRSGPGTLEEQMAAATAGNGSTGAPSKTGPGTLEQQMSAASAQSASSEGDTSDMGSNAGAEASATPDESGDQMAAVSPAPSSEPEANSAESDDRIAVPANVVASARLALPGVDFRSVSVRDEEDGQLFALRGEAPDGTPVSVAVEADGQIVSVDRQIEPEQVPEQVNSIATALLPDRSVDRVMLSTRENYKSYFVFQGKDSTSAPFALEIRSDGREARFVRPN